MIYLESCAFKRYIECRRYLDSLYIYVGLFCGNKWKPSEVNSQTETVLTPRIYVNDCIFIHTFCKQTSTFGFGLAQLYTVMCELSFRITRWWHCTLYKLTRLFVWLFECCLMSYSTIWPCRAGQQTYPHVSWSG